MADQGSVGLDIVFSERDEQYKQVAIVLHMNNESTESADASLR